MPESIALAQLKGLLADGVQLVDVLAPEEYAAGHLPGAVNLPLKQLNAESGTTGGGPVSVTTRAPVVARGDALTRPVGRGSRPVAHHGVALVRPAERRSRLGGVTPPPVATCRPHGPQNWALR
jgi:hypothetical protein